MSNRRIRLSRWPGGEPLEALARSQVRTKCPIVPGHDTGDDRSVDALRLSPFELLDQSIGNRFVLAEDQQAAHVK